VCLLLSRYQSCVASGSTAKRAAVIITLGGIVDVTKHAQQIGRSGLLAVTVRENKADVVIKVPVVVTGIKAVFGRPVYRVTPVDEQSRELGEAWVNASRVTLDK
jgi:hypothetical protein